MKRPEIKVLTGKFSGKVFKVPDMGLRLGRSSTNDISVPDEEMSRNHCLFEKEGADDIRVVDLATANGTFVNGRMLGKDPQVLKVGDIIEAGSTQLKVVGEEPAKVEVDLGLAKSAPVATAEGSKKRSPIMNVLWVLTVIILGGAVWVVMKTPFAAKPVETKELVDEDPAIKEVYYEKVEASTNGIFRYELRLSSDGVLSVSIDDVPKENRHITKSCKLDEQALKNLQEMLAYRTIRILDREYAGMEPENQGLESWALKVVYANRWRSIKVVNTQEPEAFRSVREKLEAFSKNELGVWAIQYSRDRLIALAEEQIEIGRMKWEDRDVQHGNVFDSMTAYREALFYLETIDPKPECYSAARAGMEKSRQMLDDRYKDQRFLADRAINLGQWEGAQRELRVLLEMIPDRGDDRNREATEKLLDVEKRLKGVN